MDYTLEERKCQSPGCEAKFKVLRTDKQEYCSLVCRMRNQSPEEKRKNGLYTNINGKRSNYKED